MRKIVTENKGFKVSITTYSTLQDTRDGSPFAYEVETESDKSVECGQIWLNNTDDLIMLANALDDYIEFNKLKKEV